MENSRRDLFIDVVADRLMLEKKGKKIRSCFTFRRKQV